MAREALTLDLPPSGYVEATSCVTPLFFPSRHLRQTSTSLSPFRKFHGHHLARVLFSVAPLLTWLALAGSPAHAAIITWDGGGATNNWSEAANWSTAVPGSADIATFDGTSAKPATIDVSISVAGINITSAYSGTITQASGVTVTVGTSDYIQVGGTFTGGDSTIDFNDAFTLSGGTFTATSGTINVDGNFTVSGTPTFTVGTNTLTLDGGAATIDVNSSLTLYHLTINSTGTKTVAASDTLVVGGTLTLTNGSVNQATIPAGGTIDAQSEVTHASTFDGGTGLLAITGTATRTITLTGGGELPGVTLNAANVTMNGPSSSTTTFEGTTTSFTLQAGTVTGGAGALTFNLAVSQSGGTFTGGTTTTFNGNTTISAGTFNAGTTTAFGNAAGDTFGLSGTGTFNAAGTVTFTGAATISGGTFAGGSATLDFNAAFTLSGGTFTATSGTTSFADDVTVSGTGTFSESTGTVVFDGGAATIDVLTSETFNHLTINSTGTKTVAASDTLVVGGTLTLTNGSVNQATIPAGGTIDARGNLEQATTMNGGTGLVVIDGTGDQTFTGGGSTTLGKLPDVTINKSSGTLTLVSIIRTTNAWTISAGTVDAGTSTLAGTGRFTLSSGTTLRIRSTDGITSSSATGHIHVSGSRSYSTGANYTYNGTAAQATGNGLPTTVNNLTINNSAGVTASASTTIDGTLTFTSGDVTTGSNTIFISSTGSVSRTSGHVVGNLGKHVATGATSRTFEVGTGTDYTPVDVAFGNVSVADNLTAKSTAGDHADVASSGIDSTKSVNRSWTLTKGASLAFDSYSATFNSVASDLDAGADTTIFIVAKLDGSTWSKPTIGTRTSTSTQVTGMTSFSEFQIGEPTLTQAVFTTQPPNSTAAVAFYPQPVVTIRDSNGNTVTTGPDATATITLTLQSGTGTLSGTTSMAAVAGVANFTGKGLSINLAGSKTLRATKAATTASGGTPAATVDSATFTISNGSTHAEVQTGTTEGGAVTSVTTSDNLTAVNQNLYLAAISTTPNVAANSVTGLGLTWTLVRAQCGARGQTRTEIWWASGTPTAGTVTANFTAFSGGAAIVVHRYSGVHLTSPIGNSDSTNTLGVGGGCSGGTDTSTYSFATLDTSQANSLVFSAVGEALRTHTAGSGYTERADIQSGSGSSSAGVATQDQLFSTATTNLTVGGSFDGTVDWSVVALEIKVRAGAPAVLIKTAGDAQSIEIRTTFATNLQVRVQDSFGNNVADGTSVTFTAPASGASGTFAASGTRTTIVSTSGGLASAAAFTAGGLQGNYLVSATSGAAPSVHFSLTNTIIGGGGGGGGGGGILSRLAFTTQPGNATIGGLIPGPPKVTVQDECGNPVTSPEFAVSITIKSGTGPAGVTLQGTTSVTTFVGTATFDTLSIGTAETYQLTASTTGIPSVDSAVFTVTPAATFGSWTRLPVPGRTPSGPALASFMGELHLIVRGTDSGIFHAKTTAGLWNDFTSLGGVTPSEPAAVEFQRELWAIVRGSNNLVYTNRFNGVSWSGWSEVPGGGLTLSGPGAAVVNGELHLFVRGIDDQIYENRFNGVSWSGWSEVPPGGLTRSGPRAGVLSSTLHLFVRGIDDQIYENRFNGVSWSGWSEVPGSGLTPSGPAAATLNGEFDLFVRGIDDQIYENRFNGVSWSGWSEVGIGLTPSDPGATATSSSLHLAVRGRDDGIYLNQTP